MSDKSKSQIKWSIEKEIDEFFGYATDERQRETQRTRRSRKRVQRGEKEGRKRQET